MFIMNAGVRHPEYCFLIQMSKNRTEGDFRHLPAQCTTLAHQRNYILGGKERLYLPTPVLWITCDEKRPFIGHIPLHELPPQNTPAPTGSQ